MYTINSETMTEEYKAENTTQFILKFSIDNGNTGELTVSDPLLDSVERATERAKSEFIKNSYRLKEIGFVTHRTDITKNMIINVHGVPYIVKSISTAIDDKTIKSRIKAVRYE